MVNYNCPRCGFKTCIKTKYINHLRRKFLCKNKKSDNNLLDEYKKYNIIDKSECIQMSTLCHQNIQKKNDNLEKNNLLELTNFVCEYCSKNLSNRQSLWRHKKICKSNNDINLLQFLTSQIHNQKKEIETKNKQIDELIQKSGTTNITNIQNNIKLLSYNNSDISHLTDNDYLNCIKHSNFCIPYLIEKIHFNPEKPENHNLYISNLKNNYTMIYNGNKWTLKDRDEQINNLIDEKEFIIEQKLEEWLENGKKHPDVMKKFNRYLGKKENDKILNKIKQEIKLILFNNRNIINKDN